MADGLGRIDWGAPWFGPWRATGERVAARHAAGRSLCDALNQEAAAPVAFVGPSALPDSEPYERHIFTTATCPTRDNEHDFFNGLAWLAFPLAKKQLNALQAAEIGSAAVGAVRGPVRDAITVFDENGAVLSAPEPLWQALSQRDWRRLFVDLRPLWDEARLLVFGHALLEKLMAPRKNLTAHVLAMPCPHGSTAEVDAWLAGRLTAERLATKPFLPLPVLGLPGWWPENADISFYDHPSVFRPPP